ncbi:MAG: hypothetical protein Q4C13_05630, partial [Clostridia bacterium]|nr:hypothetical protein [Clostridia bacterium]
RDFTPRMYYTCNPGGVGHAWVKRLFVDRDYRGSERAGDYAFIPARVYDNPYLVQRDPSYIRTLENLPEHLRRAHLDGDWDVLAGQFFSEFSRDRHVTSPFPVPAWWRRFMAMDWGYNDPCAVLWFAVSPEGRVFVTRELYERRVLARDMAARIRRLSEGERIAYCAASPDAWQQRGLSDIDGESIAESFMKNGVPLIKADNTRIAGWQRVREYLADAEDGAPRLRIFSGCTNLIRTLPMLVFDERHTEDVGAACEDHAPEALRYGLMTRPVRPLRPAGAKPRRVYDPFSAGEAAVDGFSRL